MWDKKKIEEALHGFNLTHLGLIAVCAFGILGMTLLKNGLHIKPDAAQVNNSTRASLTYEEAKAQVMASHAQDAIRPEVENNPLLTLDPGRDSGDVLGANTENGISQLDASVTPEMLSQVQINSINVGGKVAMERYFADMESAEQYGESFVALAALSSTDPNELKEGGVKAMKVVSYLKGVKVPTEAVEFHRMKILYYTTLSQLAGSLASGSKDETTQIESSMFFTLVGKIENLETSLRSKYSI